MKNRILVSLILNCAIIGCDTCDDVNPEDKIIPIDVESARMPALYSEYETLLSSYAASENVNISSGVSALQSHAVERTQAVRTF